MRCKRKNNISKPHSLLEATGEQNYSSWTTWPLKMGVW